MCLREIYLHTGFAIGDDTGIERIPSLSLVMSPVRKIASLVWMLIRRSRCWIICHGYCKYRQHSVFLGTVDHNTFRGAIGRIIITMSRKHMRIELPTQANFKNNFQINFNNNDHRWVILNCIFLIPFIQNLNQSKSMLRTFSRFADRPSIDDRIGDTRVKRFTSERCVTHLRAVPDTWEERKSRRWLSIGWLASPQLVGRNNYNAAIN